MDTEGPPITKGWRNASPTASLPEVYASIEIPHTAGFWRKMLAFAGPPLAVSMQEAATEWGEGTTEDTMASNSRVRAKRARRELGWQPKARGCASRRGAAICWKRCLGRSSTADIRARRSS